MIRAAIAKVLCALALVLACVLAVACATDPARNSADGASAAPAPDPAADSGAISPDRDKAIAAYRDHLERYPHSPQRDSISRRLADLLLEQAADLQLAKVTTTGDAAKLEAASMTAYAEAIRYYEDLLNRNLNGPVRTKLLYQLSRAYQESGASQQALATIDQLLAQQVDTDLRLYADTRFRQGEMLFGESAYLEAGYAYQAVVDLGASVPAYEQSLYKLGWSLFKQERYPEALPPFFTFLELKIARDGAYEEQISALSLAEKEQLAELLRVISRSFAQIDGVDSVNAYFEDRGERGYEKQVYLALADLYVEREQVSEAAGTWLVLAQRDPQAAEAPRLTARAINLYRQAGFQRRVVEWQMVFVQTYGMTGAFWMNHSPEEFPQVMQTLQSSLQELAKLSHDQARSTGDAQDVQRAEQWYREYLASFADEAAAVQMNFQLAELLNENGRHREALEEYERAARSYGAHPLASDAALAALHTNEKVQQQADAADKAALTRRAIAGALRFVKTYPDHPAAPGLLAQSGTVLLEQRDYHRALAISNPIVERVNSAPSALRQVAWSLRAQVLFAQEDYPAAAAAYREALRLAGEDHARRLALQTGLASATYKQAEQALALGEPGRAAAFYQEAAILAPDEALRAGATYDAAAALLAQESWEQAIQSLEQFRRDYPDHPLQPEVTRKLAYACERSGDKPRAASEYLRLGRDSQQSETLQREALLWAVELFMQTGATRQAIIAGEQYVERFPVPSTIAVDLMQQLADLEADNGNSQRRRYWLGEIIRLDRTAGNSRTQATAASAALELAEHRLATFRHIQLVDPVQNNLARKLDAMEQAMQAFEAAIDYGIAPVSTAATHHIASMYDELGRALLDSERPASLTVEELAEYDDLLVKQAAPFAQRAIQIYTTNTQRADGDQRDPWVEKSAQQLDALRARR